MDRTATTGSLLPEDEKQQSCGTGRAAPQEDPPIYAALIREWRARGRTVPGTRDPQWVLLTAIGPSITAHRVTVPPGPG
ncbi:hypothetical protein ABZT17_24455 [Streptomyces sp. NPDC005648]|uniref:hypothetical protein n=1 Tax=Streptomyces sp. NPDC005648 TaxID=3157044 RepID=UPI00339F9DDE